MATESPSWLIKYYSYPSFPSPEEPSVAQTVFVQVGKWCRGGGCYKELGGGGGMRVIVTWYDLGLGEGTVNSLF